MNGRVQSSRISDVNFLQAGKGTLNESANTSGISHSAYYKMIYKILKKFN